MKNKYCSKCQKKFNCNADNIKDCWCFRLPKMALKDNVIGCLCESCLTKLQKKAFR